MSGERNLITDVVPFCQLGTGGWHEACYGWAVKVQPLAWVLNKRLRPLFLTLGSSGLPKLFRYGALAQFARGLSEFSFCFRTLPNRFVVNKWGDHRRSGSPNSVDRQALQLTPRPASSHVEYRHNTYRYVHSADGHIGGLFDEVPYSKQQGQGLGETRHQLSECFYQHSYRTNCFRDKITWRQHSGDDAVSTRVYVFDIRATATRQT